LSYARSAGKYDASVDLALAYFRDQWQIHGERWGAIAPSPPRKRARKIFLNRSENKSSDRKLSLIPLVSAACMSNSHFEGFEDI